MVGRSVEGETWFACYATTFQPVGSQPHAGNDRSAEQRKHQDDFPQAKIADERLRDSSLKTSDDF